MARLLHDALVRVGDEVLRGALDAETLAAAQQRLGLSETLARRYLERLRSPADGLVGDGRVDHASLETLVTLRRTYLPQVDDGRDVVDAALLEDSGLVDAG